jgi:transcription elongation GreA/GreB family factor
MSRAFVKDDDGGQGLENLPDRLISDHANLVTAEGFAMIDAQIAKLTASYASAQSSGDRNELQRVARDLRYWSSRRATAEVWALPSQCSDVQFGVSVTVLRDGERQQTWRIVGEDEADPAKGTISYVSPLAQALRGKRVGDEVTLGRGIVEVLAIGV